MGTKTPDDLIHQVMIGQLPVDAAANLLKKTIFRIVKENPKISLLSLIAECQEKLQIPVRFSESSVYIVCDQFGIKWESERKPFINSPWYLAWKNELPCRATTDEIIGSFLEKIAQEAKTSEVELPYKLKITSK